MDRSCEKVRKRRKPKIGRDDDLCYGSWAVRRHYILKVQTTSFKTCQKGRKTQHAEKKKEKFEGYTNLV